MSEFQDRTLECTAKQAPNCEGTFTYTASDQKFYNENGYSEPKRCYPCRAVKKQQRGD